MQYVRPWGVGGVSMFELVNRVILRQDTPMSRQCSKNEPFWEIRNDVMALATKIMKDKIKWF